MGTEDSSRVPPWRTERGWAPCTRSDFSISTGPVASGRPLAARLGQGGRGVRRGVPSRVGCARSRAVVSAVPTSHGPPRVDRPDDRSRCSRAASVTVDGIVAGGGGASLRRAIASHAAAGGGLWEPAGVPCAGRRRTAVGVVASMPHEHLGEPGAPTVLVCRGCPPVGATSWLRRHESGEHAAMLAKLSARRTSSCVKPPGRASVRRFDVWATTAARSDVGVMTFALPSAGETRVSGHPGDQMWV